MPFSVLIVDDHAGFRRSARRVLEAVGFSVVGEAGDIAEGLAEAARLNPSVVLLDIHLPDGCGVEHAAKFAISASVVLVSTYDEVDLEHVTAEPGVLGFIPKAELSGATLASLLPPAAVR